MADKTDSAKVAKKIIVDEKIKPSHGYLPAALGSLVDATKYAPLIAAIWAPLSTLLDIPALSQRWYLDASTGVEVPDKTASVILSSFSLAFNALANTLLVLRFSSSERWWRPATTGSVICWAVKLVFAVVNLGVFGRQTQTQDVVFAEGIWAAIMSAIIAGLIVILLTVHYFLQFDRAGTARDAAELRVTGRNFMLSVMSLVGLLALEALIFSRIEHWTYVDGIYFSVLSAFTIGFGDFYPTYNVTRIILFPFAVASIALLAVQVGVIIDFIGQRATKRKSRWRAKFESNFQARADQNKGSDENGAPKVSLVEEIDRLQVMAEREEWISMLFDLATSVFSLIVFWVVGAAIFSTTEGWAYGTTLYFCYVFFLTIGYGDLSPISSAGRVIFIVYAFIAVPVVTSFVVQTVTSMVTTYASRTIQRSRDQYAPTKTEEKLFHSHAHYVEDATSHLSKHYDLRTEDLARKQDEQVELTRLVLDLAIRLEADARSLLIDHLESGSKAQVILRADRILHMRALEHIPLPDSVAKEAEKEEAESSGRTPWLSTRRPPGILYDVPLTDEIKREEAEMEREAKQADTLEQVRRYRQTFAALLSAGSTLLALEGEERSRFERRLEDDHERDHGGLLLGSGRQGPAELATGIDV